MDQPSPAHVEIKAAALVALTVALLAGFLVYVMAARGVFEDTQRLILVADHAEGVNVGMDMTFSGFPVGRVRRIELAPDGKARILIDVATRDAHWLRTTSIFTMERSLVGDTRIRAFSGVLADPPLPDGAERPVLQGDAADQIPRVMATLRGLLENLERLSAADAPLDASLKEVHTLAARMNGRYGALAGMLGSEDNARKVIAALDRTNTLLARTDERLYRPGGLMDESQATLAQLRATLQEAQASLKKAEGVLAEAEGIAANTRAATADLGVLRAEVEASLRKAGRLIDEINRKWPFARDTEVKLP